MVTGMLPFTASGPEKNHQIMREIMTKDPIPPSALNPDIDPELEKIILKMLEKDYYSRYSSAESVLDSLIEYLNPSNKASQNPIIKKKRKKLFGSFRFRALIGLITLGIIGAIISIILLAVL